MPTSPTSQHCCHWYGLTLQLFLPGRLCVCVR